MQTYLVVAHRTLVGEHLLDHVRSLCAEDPDETCRFYLVVPVTHPRDHAWSEGEVDAAAHRRLDEGLEAFRALGVDATGEVGDANPVYAVSTALRHRPFGDDEWDGIIVSTLAPGVSHWLGLDVVSRVKREFDIPVTHLIAPKVRADA
jgi:GABA permease